MSYHRLLPQNPPVDFANSSFGFPKGSGWVRGCGAAGGSDDTVAHTCVLLIICGGFAMSYHFWLPQNPLVVFANSSFQNTGLTSVVAVGSSSSSRY